MPQTFAVLLPLLQYGASVAGAGYIASFLIDTWRHEFPLPATRPVPWPYRLLYAPRIVRLLALLLAMGISVTFTTSIALMTNQPPVPALDQAVAALLAALGSQLVHALTLSADVPTPTTLEEHPDADPRA